MELSLCSHWKRRKEFMFFFSYHLPQKVQGSLGLCRVFVAACGLSLVVASKGFPLLPWAGFSLSWLRSLQSTGARRVGLCSCSTQWWARQSWRTPHCSAACGIFLNPGRNVCPLYCRPVLIHCTTSKVPGRFLSHIWLASIDNVCHMLTLFRHPSSSPVLLVFA